MNSSNQHGTNHLEALKLVRDWSSGLILVESAAIGVVGTLLRQSPTGWYGLLTALLLVSLVGSIWVGAVWVVGTIPSIAEKLPMLLQAEPHLRAPRKLLSGLDSDGITAIITKCDLIATVGQRGFWDEQQRVSKLQEKKPVLKRLSESIPWESFRPLLDQGYILERKSSAGRKRIDPLILFKMLVLQQLFNISDEELEFQVNDRRSFEEFVGLGVMNSIPDATTVAFFRERLRKAGVIEELFEMFETYLRSQGLQARGG
ncbi:MULTISPECIES: transposase, partial [unclassified Cyanobium]|uniref:transposase n=1 Tax=unclassified Cyanobium TaxID=2627006 RepID=UPI0020CFE84E